MLPNEAKVLERPQREEAGTDQKVLVHRAPITRVGGVGGVVAHREVLVFGDGEGFVFVPEVSGAGSGLKVAFVVVLQGGDFLEARFDGELAIVIEEGGVEAKFVARNSRKALDIMRAGFLIAVAILGLNVLDAAGFEDEDFASFGFAEVVGGFVDEDEVAGIDPTLGEDLPFLDWELFGDSQALLSGLVGVEEHVVDAVGSLTVVEAEVFSETETIDDCVLGAVDGDFVSGGKDDVGFGEEPHPTSFLNTDDFGIGG